MSSKKGSSRRGALGSWIIELLLALAIWFLFVAKVDLHELLVGFPCAVVAATASSLVRNQHIVEVRGYFSEIAQIVHMPWSVLSGTWDLLVVLTRQLSGRGEAPSLLRDVAFEELEGDPRHAAMRRALASAYTSATPNFVVLGFDEQNRRMIFHQVRRSAIPKIAIGLGARP